jgi:hypothetical protein
VNGRGVAFGTGIAIAGLLCLCACDDDSKKVTHTVTFGQSPTPDVAPAVPGEIVDAGAMYTMAEVFDAEARPRAPSFFGATADTATAAATAPAAPPGAAAASPATATPKVNPDDAILERTRVACGGCFSSLPAGAGFGPPTRSAHVSVVVVPTGTVSRADVSSNDTTDGNVLACLQRTAQAAQFSDNNGGPLRTYAIEVRVSAPGANGSR